MVAVTQHLAQDRADRAIFIAMTRGIGEPVAERQSWKDTKAIMTLTDTGVIVVKNLQGKIITMYYCTVTEAKWVVNKKALPQAVYNVITKNCKNGYIKKQDEVRY